MSVDMQRIKRDMEQNFGMCNGVDGWVAVRLKGMSRVKCDANMTSKLQRMRRWRGTEASPQLYARKVS
jgi:hypothetical protein